MISVEHLSKSFGTKKAVDDLSFTVESGEVVGILGPNGAGKTTTMRLLTGFLFPDAGKVSVNGFSMFEDTAQAQRQIGYLPENNPLYKDMLVCEFLSFAAALQEVPREKRSKAFDFAVSSVGIGDVYTKPIGELSKGYRQRVGIAASLIHDPKILILDEPTEGLDPNQRTDLRGLITELAKDRTILISTHVMQEASAVCDRILIINNGRIIADGSPEQLTRTAQGSRILVLEFEGRDLEQHVRGLSGIEEFVIERASPNRLRCTITSSVQVDLRPGISKLAAQHQWIIWHLAEEERRLEDVFHRLTSV